MNTEQRNQKGITLIELIIVIAVLSILLVAVGYILIQGIRTWISQSTSVSTEDQLRAVEDRIVRDLRTSKNAVSPNTTRLEFRFLDPTNTQTNYYVLEGSTLKRSLNGGSADPIADHMQVSFIATQVTKSSTLTTSSTPLIRVDVWLEASQGNVTKSATFSVVLRNSRNR